MFSKVEFNDSKEQIDEKFIGQIIFHNFQLSGFLNEKDLIKKIKTSDYEIIETNDRPYDLCTLPNDTLVTANRADGNLTILDSNTFKLINKIDKIDDSNFIPRGLTVNSRQKCIYILDELHSQIIMTDFNFKKLDSYGNYGSNKNQFDDPSSFCFFNDYLYVSDRNNERIQILTPDLEYFNSIQLNYKPYMVKVTNKRICVTCVETTSERGVYFYDSDSLKLKHKYEESVGKLSEINASFYLLCCNSKVLHCFNTDGILIKQVNVDRLGEYLIDLYDGYMICLNQNLIITSYRMKKLLKF